MIIAVLLGPVWDFGMRSKHIRRGALAAPERIAAKTRGSAHISLVASRKALCVHSF